MKKGILVVSFGTSYEKTRKLCIRAVEKRIEKKFKDFTVRRAFTSNMIIKKLRERDNIYIDTVEEALEKFKREGFQHIYVQPLHIIPGHEYEKIIKQISKYRERDIFKTLKLSEPLLYKEEDFNRVINAINTDINSLTDKQALILMGHGTDHSANKCYKLLEENLRKKGYNNTYIGTIEGYQPIEEIIPLLKEEKFNTIKLQPFMLVAGDHVLNDMVGERNSWKTKLEKEGFYVEAEVKGLGEKRKFQKIFLDKLNKIIC